MPLRTYKCPAGHLTDVLEPCEAPDSHPCTRRLYMPVGSVLCSLTAHRGLSAPAFALKGTGWTDKGRAVSGRS